jgi:D-threonate/D-erythronate kinase
MSRVLIVADDLTGALDSAVAFAVRGMATRVVLDPGALAAALGDPGLRAVAVTTASREIPPDAAAGRVTALAAAISRFDGILFKKIDSRLKGNVAAELAALLALRPLAVLASPAIPRLGRFVAGGALTGSGVSAPMPVASLLGCAAEVPTVARDADLDAALPDDLAARIHVGAAGLAEAIARRLAPDAVPADIPPLETPLLVAIGSRDPVTLDQLAALDMQAIQAPNGVVPDLPRSSVRIARIVPGEGPVSTEVAARRFAEGIAREMRHAMPRTLFACGGETAFAILARLSVPALDIRAEVFPGVPLAVCSRTGLAVVTKSGGFGGPDLLVRFLRMFRDPPETGGAQEVRSSA